MSTPTSNPAEVSRDNYRLAWLATKCRWNLAQMLRQLESGMSPSIAVEIANEMTTRFYREACALDNQPIVNTMLDPTAVEMQARFALDAALVASAKGAPEGEARKQFWAIFRKATHASLTP